jgi:tRNA A-37 threonylcarbamoyl transferase component Bud32
MTQTLFGQIGPYVIERPIGHGGMASVFLARDSRSEAQVALKVVHLGTDQEAREILESEQRGVELQRRFCEVSRFVPKVFDSGFTDDYFYIAMEYVAGEDLSQAIHRGKLPWQRAVAITMQICEFLEEADRFEVIPPSIEDPAGTTARRILLLHNDLKPRNIRLTEGDAIKVLDFGAAKALSLSRKVTRNDFGSTAYLSPECLESGDRDAHFRRLGAWRAHVRNGPRTAAFPRGRHASPRTLDSLERGARIDCGLLPAGRRGGDREAARAVPRGSLRQPRRNLCGPGQRVRRSGHEGAGRRLAKGTRRSSDPTNARRTADQANRRGFHSGDIQPAPSTAMPATAPAAAPPPRRRFPRLLVQSLAIVFVTLALNEGCVASRANRLAHTVALQDFSGLSDLWPQYESLAGWSFMGGAGVAKLESALTTQTMVLAERVMANYRTPLPTVRENQWKAARDALARQVGVAPREKDLRAALRYCEGHLYRINGEAAKTRGQQAQAQQQFTEAVVAFREAAALRSNWPDPFLGLARTFIYGLEDVDRGAEALAQAEKSGHHPGERETTQLADGYRARGETLARTAQTLKAMPQEARLSRTRP